MQSALLFYGAYLIEQGLLTLGNRHPHRVCGALPKWTGRCFNAGNTVFVEFERFQCAVLRCVQFNQGNAADRFFIANIEKCPSVYLIWRKNCFLVRTKQMVFLAILSGSRLCSCTFGHEYHVTNTSAKIRTESCNEHFFLVNEKRSKRAHVNWFNGLSNLTPFFHSARHPEQGELDHVPAPLQERWLHHGSDQGLHRVQPSHGEGGVLPLYQHCHKVRSFYFT